jgi:hypothetical protein
MAADAPAVQAGGRRRPVRMRSADARDIPAQAAAGPRRPRPLAGGMPLRRCSGRRGEALPWAPHPSLLVHSFGGGGLIAAGRMMTGWAAKPRARNSAAALHFPPRFPPLLSMPLQRARHRGRASCRRPASPELLRGAARRQRPTGPPAHRPPERGTYQESVRHSNCKGVSVLLRLNHRCWDGGAPGRRLPLAGRMAGAPAAEPEPNGAIWSPRGIRGTPAFARAAVEAEDGAWAELYVTQVPPVCALVDARPH